MQEIKGGIGAVPGIQTAGISCGIKSGGLEAASAKKDLALIYSTAPANTVGLFTCNQVKAAPVLFCRQHLPSPQIQAILINSGNANACTGEEGLNKVSHLTAALAQGLDLPPAAVLMASTGVIGEPLPAKKIETALPSLVQQLTPHDSQAAAQAILTTDMVTKQTAIKINIRGQEITIGGIAKGSGMICPKLATMLAFLSTDLKVEIPALEQALKAAVRKSFEQITVDGDMSTNDTVLLMANGVSNLVLQPDDDEWPVFQEGLNYVCRQLAKMIIKDGEGATKVIEVRVQQAATEDDARRIALQVANSNLVKTALFAADANWGRIMAAAGAAGVAFDPQRVDILIGDVLLVKNGVGLGKEAEKQVQPLLQQPEVTISIVLNQGQAQAVIWGNDLSYDYIKINAEYRT